MENKLKYLIFAVVVLVFASTVTFLYFQQNKQKPVACPTLAKLCPDGSSVSPEGPKCEFPACPASQTAGWKTYTNNQHGFNIQYSTTFFPIVNLTPEPTADIVVGEGVVLFQSPQTDTGLNLSVIYFPITNKSFIQQTQDAEGRVANVTMQNLTPSEIGGVSAYTFQSGFAGQGTVCIDKEVLIPAGNGSINLIFGKCDQDPCMIKECPNGDHFNLTFTSDENKMFEQMLSTFKFANQVMDWTKYTNDQLMAMANSDWQNQAMYFKGLEGNFLIIDQGTGPDPRGLTIYDLKNKKQVFSGSYSSTLDITTANVNYWSPTSQKVNLQNCPDSVKWTSEGLGAEIESHVSFSLTTLQTTSLGETRCSATQG